MKESIMGQGGKQTDFDPNTVSLMQTVPGGAVPVSLRTPCRFYMATQWRNIKVNQGFGMPSLSELGSGENPH